MLSRPLIVLLACAGLLLLAYLALRGSDWRRAAADGPRWRRVLVGAALMLLTCLGCQAADKTSAPPTGGEGTGANAGEGLEGSRAWQQVTAVWREAEAVASGSRGQYPFDRAGKEKLLSGLEEAQRGVGSLRDAGLLTAAEAALLIHELGVLAARARAFREKEMSAAMCYAPMPAPIFADLKRVQDRLPLLRQLAASKAVKPAVLEKAVVAATQEVQRLADSQLQPLDAQKRKEALAARRETEELLQQLRGLLPKPVGGLDARPEWQVVVAAWREVTPLAESGKSTVAQRASAERALSAARQAIARLSLAGLLSAAEAQLLYGEADHLNNRMRRDPPTDQQVMCYVRLAVVEATQSWERLNARLHLLKQMAALGRVNRQALEKVLPSIERDLATLGSQEEVQKMDPGRRSEAERLRREAEDLVRQLRALSGKSGE